MRCWEVFFALALLGCILACEAASCMYPELPTDLDLITSVEATAFREVHLHGMYSIGNDAYDYGSKMMVHNLTLQYDEKQRFRISIQPHDAEQVDLELITTADGKMVHCSKHGGRGVERMIYAVLKPNVKYTLMVKYSLAWNDVMCPKLMMELATQPDSLSVKFEESCEDSDTAPVVSPIFPKDESNYYYEFQSPNDVFVDVGGADDLDRFSVIGVYPIRIPHIAGRHQQWKLKAEIQSRFLDGGDFVFVVTPNNVTGGVISPQNCSLLGCIVGERALRNRFIVQTILWGGNTDLELQQYKLWLVRRRPETDLAATCAPLSLHIVLFPLQEEESFVTCDVDPLPSTFHFPGMYDNSTGIMMFSQDTLVNLSTRTQMTRLVPKFNSIMRAQVGNHETLDIDLYLLKVDSATGNVGIVAYSLNMKGPEGVIYELEKNQEYLLKVSIPYPHHDYDGRDHDYYQFCDSYELSVHVFPQVLLDPVHGDTCHGVKPNFGGMQEAINGSLSYDFSLPNTNNYPFLFTVDKSKKVAQQEIVRLPIFLPKALDVMVIVPSDSYNGTVAIQLIAKTVDGSSSGTLYGRRRAVGSSLFASLEEGWYDLVLLTPYVQMMSSTWESSFTANFPYCIRYNVLIRVQAQGSCLDALPLPDEYSFDRYSHRHVMDEYAVPFDGIQYTLFEPQADSVFHLLVASSDTPFEAYMAPGDYAEFDVKKAIAKTHSIFDTSDRQEMIVVLYAGKKYTLFFDFRSGDDVSYSCETFEVEMSVAKIGINTEEKCRKYPELQKSVNLHVLALPYDTGLQMFSFSPTAANEYQDWTQKFTIQQRATIRVNFEYQFTMHAFGVIVCACDDDESCGTECDEAYGYFNGLELPALELEKGTYILFIKPWTFDIGTKDEQTYINYCTYGSLQFSVRADASKPAPSLCPTMMQYLPKTLNSVSLVSPFFGDECHFEMSVLVSAQHLSDSATVTPKRDSVFRAYIPDDLILTSMSVSLAGTRIASTLSKGTAIYVKLLRGKTYDITVSYYLTDDLDPSQCLGVPIEMSLTLVQDLPHLSSSALACKSTLPFPTTPFHHGHDTLYRIPNSTFSNTISFEIGELGGDVEFDVRYNFETSGLATDLYGKQFLPSGSWVKKSFPWVFYPDRAFIRTTLLQGRYTLEIRDPVDAKSYELAGAVATCVPYSLHLRFSNRGNYSDFTNPPPVPPRSFPPGQTGSPAATPVPSLLCPLNIYDTLPPSFGAAGDVSYSSSGTMYGIPFGSAQDYTYEIYQRTVHILKSTASTSIRINADSIARVWLRSTGRTLVNLALFQPNSSEAVAIGQFFGYHTQSLTFRPGKRFPVQDGTSMRLQIEFYNNHLPRVHEDYDDCDQKKIAETYELYVAVFPRDRVASLVSCSDAQAAMGKTDRLPPAHLRLGSSLIYLSKDYFLTEDDMIVRHTSPSNSVNTVASSRLFATLDDALPRTDELRDKVDVLFNTTIDIPAGTSGLQLTAHVKYDIDIINLRLSLVSTDNGTVAESYGTPLVSRDGSYRAEAVLETRRLSPGKYALVFAEANAARLSHQSSLCIPFHLMLELSATQYPGDAPPPPTVSAKPYVSDFYPTSETNLDVSDPLELTLTLSEDAFLRVESGKYVAVLVDHNGDGSTAVTKPHSQYFWDPKTLVVVFPAYTLKWAWTYQVAIDSTALHPQSSPQAGTYDFTEVTRTLGLFSTGHCGCDNGACAPGGGCQCIAGSESCYACPVGFKLSLDRVPLGPSSKAVSYRTCIVNSASLGPSPPPLGPSVAVPTGAVPQPPRATNVPVALDPKSTQETAQPPIAETNQKPPLHTLRYVLAYVAVFGMLLYTAQFAFKYRHTAQRRFLNPFKRGRAAQRPIASLNDDNEDEDFGGENEAIVARQ